MRFGGMFKKSINGQTTRPNGTPAHRPKPLGGQQEIWRMVEQIQTRPGRVESDGGWHGKYQHGNANLQPLRRTMGEIQEPFLETPSDNSIGGGQRVSRTGGTWASKYAKKIIAWDVAPKKEYFDELFRISRNQIIWGGNYFDLPPTRCFVIYRKTNIPLKGFSMAPVEYAWTSFNQNAVMIEAFSQGTQAEPRFHPTQKPISLYEELLERFAKEGDTILDTHVGSGSSLIACENMHFKYVGFEIDKYYYEKATERIKEYTAQIRMF